jgi:hypothetical protein
VIRIMEGPPYPQFVYFVVNADNEVISPPLASRSEARALRDQSPELRVRRARLTLYSS